jgi:hypothetical protein
VSSDAFGRCCDDRPKGPGDYYTDVPALLYPWSAPVVCYTPVEQSRSTTWCLPCACPCTLVRLVRLWSLTMLFLPSAARWLHGKSGRFHACRRWPTERDRIGAVELPWVFAPAFTGVALVCYPDRLAPIVLPSSIEDCSAELVRRRDLREFFIVFMRISALAV